jgi:hypothetical protein
MTQVRYQGTSVARRECRGRDAGPIIFNDTFPSLHSDSNENNRKRKDLVLYFHLQPQAEQVVNTVESSLKNCSLTVC